MKLNRKKIIFPLIALYLIGMLVSAYILFNIEDKLIYDLNILDLSDAGRADAVFYSAYAVIGITMIVGLLAIYYSFKNEDANIVYVEKTRKEQKEEEERNEQAEGKKAKLERKALDKYLSSNKPDNQKNLNELLNHICKNLEASQGAFYIKEHQGDVRTVVLKASYAMAIAESEVISFEFGEGLVGQVAKEQKLIYLDEVPEGYLKVISGLGKSSPSYILILPVASEDELLGVVEIASFVPVKKEDITLLEKYFQDLGAAISGTGSKKKAEKEPELVAADVEVADEKTKKNKKKTGDK
ncbi:MAG: GAF domain-containing protein [Candidatus Cyclobacteriaceae bacterium M2_1C_046]